MTPSWNLVWLTLLCGTASAATSYLFLHAELAAAARKSS
jgi:hypothetical protein